MSLGGIQEKRGGRRRAHKTYSHWSFAMRTGRQFKKRGFTLVETVVTVGIVAALAAVVYPTVVKQFDSTDPARGAEDMANIRTAIETFSINVRPQQPRDIEDLVNKITSLDSTAIGSNYSSSEIASWLGPYLGLAVTDANGATGQADTVQITGFSGRIINRLPLYNTDNTLNGGAGDTVATSSAANAEFVSVRIVSLSGAQFNSLNLLIDGPAENTTALRRSAGSLRCPQATYTDDALACANAYFLASAKK
jgi:prepilin-type N-terminal cleavage/methylation domain-containing protein